MNKKFAFLFLILFTLDGCTASSIASGLYKGITKSDDGIHATANIGDNKKSIRAGDDDAYNINKSGAIYVNKTSMGYVIANNITLICVLIILIMFIIWLIGYLKKSPREMVDLQRKDDSYHHLIELITDMRDKNERSK